MTGTPISARSRLTVLLPDAMPPVSTTTFISVRFSAGETTSVGVARTHGSVKGSANRPDFALEGGLTQACVRGADAGGRCRGGQKEACGPGGSPLRWEGNSLK